MQKTPLSSRLSGGLPVPALAKVGALVILIGLLDDLVEHTLVFQPSAERVRAFPASEHLAHFIVVLGMLLVLAGIVADGIRSPRRVRHDREGSSHDAIR